MKDTENRVINSQELPEVKKIEALIRPVQFDQVAAALVDAGVVGMNVTNVRGYGRQKGQTESYRGVKHVIEFHAKVKIEIVVEDEACEFVVEKLIAAAQTGQIGDGKIFIRSVEEIIRIRTGETDFEAL